MNDKLPYISLPNSILKQTAIIKNKKPSVRVLLKIRRIRTEGLHPSYLNASLDNSSLPRDESCIYLWQVS